MSLEPGEWTEEELEELRRCRDRVEDAWDAAMEDLALGSLIERKKREGTLFTLDTEGVPPSAKWVDSWCDTVLNGEYLGTLNGLSYAGRRGSPSNFTAMRALYAALDAVPDTDTHTDTNTD